MVIKQSKILSISKLNSLEDGTSIKIGHRIQDDDIGKLKKLGFTQKLEAGESCLPAVIGPATRKNANGYLIVHKDKPKELASRMIEWTYDQWCGRGQTRTVTDSTSVTYERYPRTHVSPLSLEFTLAIHKDEKLIVSDSFIKNENNKDQIILAVNVLLESFGECEILDCNNDNIISPKVVRLNWKILPKGKYPWNIQKERIAPFIDKASGTNQKVIVRRQENINKYNPDFTAIGSGGFGGYIVHGFSDKNLYILESTQVNNATYVIKEDWEKITQLSKAEILNSKLHEKRLIHNKSWYNQLHNLCNEYGINEAN